MVAVYGRPLGLWGRVAHAARTMSLASDATWLQQPRHSAGPRSWHFRISALAEWPPHPQKRAWPGSGRISNRSDQHTITTHRHTPPQWAAFPTRPRTSRTHCSEQIRRTSGTVFPPASLTNPSRRSGPPRRIGSLQAIGSRHDTKSACIPPHCMSHLQALCACTLWCFAAPLAVRSRGWEKRHAMREARYREARAKGQRAACLKGHLAYSRKVGGVPACSLASSARQDARTAGS